MQTAKNAFVLVQMTLKQFWEVEGARRFVLNNVGLVTCSFSVNYVLDELEAMFRATNIPIVGCCYMYDEVDADGCLINTPGIKMSLDSEDSSVANVKWMESSYTEPAVTVKSIDALRDFESTACFEDEGILKSLRYVWSRNLRHLMAENALS